jgi:hypothetical protein
VTIASGIHSGLRTQVRFPVDIGRSWALLKTGGVDGTYDASGHTDAIFTGTTIVSFVIPAAVGGSGDAFCVGLSADNPNANYTGIDFGLINDVGTMFRNANGVLTSLGATVRGDRWEVVRTMPGGAVTCRKNGVVVSTFAGTSVAALYVDSSLRFTSDRVPSVGVTHDGVAVDLVLTTVNTSATKE